MVPSPVFESLARNGSKNPVSASGPPPPPPPNVNPVLLVTMNKSNDYFVAYFTAFTAFAKSVACFFEIP